MVVLKFVNNPFCYIGWFMSRVAFDISTSKYYIVFVLVLGLLFVDKFVRSWSGRENS